MKSARIHLRRFAIRARAGFVRKAAHGLAPMLLLVLPAMKDGPLDIDLPVWKLTLVAALLCLTVTATSVVQLNPWHFHSAFLLAGGIGATLAAFCMSPRPDLGIPILSAYLTASFYFLLLCRVYDARLLRTAIRCLLVLAFGVCVVALAQYVTIVHRLNHPWLLRLIPPEAKAYFFDLGNTVGDGGLRLPSIFLHPNQLGHVLALLLGFLLPFCFLVRRTRDRFFHLCAVAMIGSCTLLTLSRGALLTMALEVAAVLTLCGRPGSKMVRTLLASAALLAAAALPLLHNLPPLLARFVSAGLSFRWMLWSRAWEMIGDHGLFGLGPGCASYAMLTHFPPTNPAALIEAYSIQRPFDPWGSAPHNYYLTVLLEGGIFALAFRLLLYATVLWIGVGLIRRLRRPRRAAAIGATVPLGCEFLRGFFDSYNFLASVEAGALTAFFLATILYLDAAERLRPGHLV